MKQVHLIDVHDSNNMRKSFDELFSGYCVFVNTVTQAPLSLEFPRQKY